MIQNFEQYFDRALDRAGRAVGRRYANRHPGPVARRLIRLAAPLVVRMTPADPWTLGAHAPFWMRAAHETPMHPLPPPQRIFMFAAYRGQFTLELTLAALLAWRGHAVTIGYLPKLRSSVKRPLEDHPSAPAYLADALALVDAASGGKVRVVKLAEHEQAETPDQPYAAQQSRLGVMMALGRETISREEPESAVLFDHFEAAGAYAQRVAHGYLSKARDEFDMALIGNGATFEAANICHVCRLIGMPFTTMEKFQFRNVRVMNHGDDFRAFLDLERAWDSRERLGYLGQYREVVAARAMQLMEERRRSATSNWMLALQKTPEQATDDALREAGVDVSRPFVLVCTNVPYDAGFDRLARFFPTMREWLIATVKTLMERTELQVVVRCHPAEAMYYGGNEPSEDNLAKAGFAPGGRLFIIPGTQSTNTYGLMERCKFAAVFSTTAGLEMAMMGKKVAVGADIYYRARGFTVDADDAAGYLENLVKLAEEPGQPALMPARAFDAQLMYFLLHFTMQWPFPWDKAGAPMRDLPPHILVRSQEMRRYLPTLDALATPPADFHARIDEFLSVDRCGHLPRMLDNPTRTAPQELQGVSA